MNVPLSGEGEQSFERKRVTNAGRWRNPLPWKKDSGCASVSELQMPKEDVIPSPKGGTQKKRTPLEEFSQYNHYGICFLKEKDFSLRMF